MQRDLKAKLKMTKFIRDKEKRHLVFSTKKSRLLSRAYKLSKMTGTQVLVVIQSETGDVYTYATKKLRPVIASEEGKELLRTCLGHSDPTSEHAENENSEDDDSASSVSSKSTANTAGENPEDIDPAAEGKNSPKSLWSRFKSLWI